MRAAESVTATMCCPTLTAARSLSGVIATSPARSSFRHPDRCRKQLIRRFAAAAVIAEQMEAKLANGGEINITEHAQLSSTLVRIAQRIGINRRFKDITPALPDYLDAAEADDEFVHGEQIDRKAETEPVP